MRGRKLLDVGELVQRTIVEDEEHLRESLRIALEDEDYRVETAANGQEALELMARRKPLPDAVILDLMLPVLDGNRVYQAMQADPDLAAIPVVVSTDSSSCACSTKSHASPSDVAASRVQPGGHTATHTLHACYEREAACRAFFVAPTYC